MSATDFTTTEGLRLLLVRLHYSGPDAWKDDEAATELLKFAMSKYRALACKHRLEPQDAGVAAFQAMGTRAVRTAADPWAVITRAVQLTLIYDARAQGLLCSTHQARRSSVSAHHDAERFSDRGTELVAFHPAFHIPAEQDSRDWDEDVARDDGESANAWMAADQAVQIMTDLGWPLPRPEDASSTSVPASSGTDHGRELSNPFGAIAMLKPSSIWTTTRG